MTLTRAIETKQRRSQRTLEHILEAAEELLQDRDFDRLTMAELAEHAGCAVGTLYGRIPNKDSLLACLYERLDRQIQEQVGNMVAASAELGLEERVTLVCGVAVDFLRATRGVNRAVTMHLWSRPDDEFGFRRKTTTNFKQAARFIAECKDEIAHPNAHEACEFGLLAVSTMAQDRLLFGDRSGIQLRYSGRALKQGLTSLLLAYLRTPA